MSYEDMTCYGAYEHVSVYRNPAFKCLNIDFTRSSVVLK